MELTVEANKKRQKNIDVKSYINNELVKLYIRIYKKGELKDSISLTFPNRESCMIHVENLIKTTEYCLHCFSSDPKHDDYPERYFITLRK